MQTDAKPPAETRAQPAAWGMPPFQRAVVGLSLVVVVLALIVVSQAPARTSFHTPPLTVGLAKPPAASAVVNGDVLSELVGDNAWVEVTPHLQLGKGDLLVSYFVSPQAGWTFEATGADAASTTVTAWRTAAGGESWHPAQVGHLAHGASLLSASFVSPSHGWLLVSFPETGNSRPGAIFETRDGGLTWKHLAAPTGGVLTFTTETTGWLVGGRGIVTRNQLFVTHDGGHSWAEVKLRMPAGVSETHVEMTLPAFTSLHDGVLAANLETQIELYATHNGGQTWVPMSSFPVAAGDRTVLPEMAVRGQQVLIFAGTTARRSQDGGQSWSPANRPDKQKVLALGLTGNGTFWAITAPTGCSGEFSGRCDGEALYASADGLTWAPPKRETPDPS